MNNKVQKLMTLADRYALQLKFDLVNELNGKPTEGAQSHRQLLQDELTRLLTPPSKPEAREYKPCTVCGGAFELKSNGYNTFLRCNQCGHVPYFDSEGSDIAARLKLAHMKSEQQHGITGESK